MEKKSIHLTGTVIRTVINITINTVIDINLNIIYAVFYLICCYFMYFICYFPTCFRADLWFLLFLLLEDDGDLGLPVHYTLLQLFYHLLTGQQGLHILIQVQLRDVQIIHTYRRELERRRNSMKMSIINACNCSQDCNGADGVRLNSLCSCCRVLSVRTMYL